MAMTNEQLKEYFSLAAVQDLREIMDTPYDGEADGNSLPYRRRQKKMLADPRKWCRERQRPVWKRVARQAACFLLVGAIAFGTLMAVSPTARAAVIHFIKEVLQNEVVYRYTKTEYSDHILPDYEITALPDGYEIVEEHGVSGVNNMVVYNLPDAEDEGYPITLYYGFMEGGSRLGITGEGLYCTEIIDGDFKGEFYTTTTDSMVYQSLIWQDEQQNIMFSIDAKGSAEDLLALAKSVSPD